jgi:hypothetical protein
LAVSVDQRVGVVEPNGIGGRSLAGAAAERLGVGIAGAIERGIAAHELVCPQPAAVNAEQ